MSEILIQAEHVSKKFCRSLKRSLWYGMKDVAHSLNPWSRTQQETDLTTPITAQSLRKDEFWALQDINFEVRRGECLGLIGHNGAGKSTLLKMLNGLIRPDHGRITMRGRIAALIELNAGFNNLLTGRENIYSQAALLGFSRDEIQRRFDDIVEFSELGPFIDMAVQNYSSGMRVKLGFAVSAQMEPDILLIDEVLAVGDLGFRYKCLNRIGELLKSSAVVFVSHSMPQVMRVSSHLLMLKGGRLAHSGCDVARGIEAYYQLFGGGSLTVAGSGEVILKAIEARSDTGESCSFEGDLQVQHGESIAITLTLWSEVFDRAAVVQVLIWNHEMVPILDVMGKSNYGYDVRFSGRLLTVEVLIPNLQLNAGRYSVSVIVTAPGLAKVYCQADHVFRLTMGSGSPASGAACVVAGDWRTRQSGISLLTAETLREKSAADQRISHEDSCIFDEIRPGDIAIDCGANVGLVSAEFASRGATVHAFEPDPVAFEVLDSRFRDVSTVHCHNEAVSNANGRMEFYFRKERSQDPVAFSVGSTLLAEKTDVSTGSSIHVQVRRLADFLQQFERVRILKLDIEGAECDVLDDLLETELLSRIDLVLVETHEQWIPQTIPRLAHIREQLRLRGLNHVHLNWI